MEVQFKTAALLEVAFFLVKSKYTRANAQHQEYITKNSPMEVNFSFSLITIPSPTTQAKVAYGQQNHNEFHCILWLPVLITRAVTNLGVNSSFPWIFTIIVRAQSLNLFVAKATAKVMVTIQDLIS